MKANLAQFEHHDIFITAKVAKIELHTNRMLLTNITIHDAKVDETNNQVDHAWVEMNRSLIKAPINKNSIFTAKCRVYSYLGVDEEYKQVTKYGLKRFRNIERIKNVH